MKKYKNNLMVIIHVHRKIVSLLLFSSMAFMPLQLTLVLTLL